MLGLSPESTCTVARRSILPLLAGCARSRRAGDHILSFARGAPDPETPHFTWRYMQQRPVSLSPLSFSAAISKAFVRKTCGGAELTLIRWLLVDWHGASRRDESESRGEVAMAARRE